jgi:hypothetical protein
VVAESTSAQAAKIGSSSVDETPFEHYYLLPEDEEVKEIDYSIYSWWPDEVEDNWEAWQVRQQQRLQEWREFQESERLLIEAEIIVLEILNER